MSMGCMLCEILFVIRNARHFYVQYQFRSCGKKEKAVSMRRTEVIEKKKSGDTDLFAKLIVWDSATTWSAETSNKANVESEYDIFIDKEC